MPTTASTSQLLKLASTIQHDQHFFTMLHMASSLPDNMGGNPEKALTYMQSIVNALGGLPNMAAPVAARLKQVFAEMQTGIEITNTEKLITHIRAHQRCYLPAYWSTERSGHMVALKCTQVNDNEFDFCILNKGAGAQFHAGIEQDGFQHKINYQSATYRFNLNSPLFKRFLQGILEMRNAVKIKNTYEYGEHDLYHLLTLGEHIATPFKITEASTIQRTGCCTITCSKLVVKDILLTEFNFSKNQIKQVMLFMRTIGLIAAMNHPESSSLFLQQALRAFDFNVLKLYPEELSQIEFNQALQISKLVKDRMEQNTEKTAAAIANIKMPATVKIIAEKKQTQQVPQETQPKAVAQQFMRSDLVSYKKYPISFKTENWQHPSQILPRISELMYENSFCDQVKTLELLRSIPAPSGKKDDPFYDQLDQEVRRWLLNSLLKLANQRDQYYTGETSQYKCEILLRIYDLYIQLLEKSEEFQFNGQYTLKLDTQHFSLFQHPDITTQYFIKELVTRIKEREKNRIGLFGPYISLHGVCETRKYILQNWLTGDNKAELYGLYRADTNSNDRDDDNVLHWLFHTTAPTPLSSIIKLSTIMHCFHKPYHQAHYDGTKHFDVVVQCNKRDSTTGYQDCYAVAHQHSFELEKVSQAHFDNYEPNIPNVSRGMCGSSVKKFKKFLPKQFPKNAAFFDWSENIIYGPLPQKDEDRELFNTAMYLPYQIKKGVLFPLHQFDSSVLSTSNSEHLQQIASFHLAPSCRVTRVLAYATRTVEAILAGSNDVNEEDLVTILNQHIYAYGALEHALTYQVDITLQAFHEFLTAICKPENPNHLSRVITCLVGEYYSLLEEAAEIYHFNLNQFKWPVLRKAELLAGGLSPEPKTILIEYLPEQKEMHEEFASYFLRLFQLQEWQVESRVNKNQCELVSIQHQELNLRFNYKNNKFESNEFAGYELSLKPTVAFDGKLRFITLVHPSKPAILLLPKRNFRIQNESDQFFDKEVFDKDYFTYFTDKTGNINSEDHHALFYFAYIAKVMGEYRLAIKMLKQSYFWDVNDDSIVNMYRTLTSDNTDSSPLSAAFHLHVIVRILTHNKKITRSKAEDLTHNPKLDLLKENFKRYQLSLASNKENLSLIPKDLQLTEGELAGVAHYLEVETHYLLYSNCNDLCRTEIQKAVNKITISTIVNHDKALKESVIAGLNAAIDLPEIGMRLSNENINANKFITDHFSTYLKAICNHDPITTKLCFSHLFTVLHNQFDIPAYITNNQDYLVENLMPVRVALLLFAHKIRYEIPEKENYLKENCLIEQFAAWRVKKIDAEFAEELLSYFNIENHKSPTEKMVREPALVQAPKFQWPTMKEMVESTTENLDLFKKYFVKESTPAATGDFPLSLEHSSGCDTALLQRLQTGHAINQQMKIDQYRLHPDKSAQDLKVELETALQTKQQQLRKAKTKLHQLLAPLKCARAEVIQLMQDCLALPSLDIEQAVRTLSKQDLKPILDCLPTLTESEAYQVVLAVYEYMVAENATDLMKEALALFNEDATFPPHQQHLVGQSLAKKRNYSAKLEPSFLTYEFYTGRIIREQQIAALQKLQRPSQSEYGYKHALLEFDAGGGKGEVITPLLIESTLTKESALLPVVVLTRELYQPGIDVLTKRLQATFGRQVEVIMRDINDNLDEEELTTIYSLLTFWKKNRRCLIIQSGTWHAINLAKKMAYCNNDPKLAKIVEDILEFFKNDCLKIEDEVQITSDPIEETIISFGELSYLPKYELDFLIILYEYLTAHNLPEYQKLADKIQLRAGSKLHINSETQLWIQKHLIRIITQLPMMKSLNQIDLHVYLRDKPDTQPEWLVKLENKNPELAGIIDLSVEFIHQLLPHILTMQLGKDYGRAINPTDYLTVPKVDGNDVMTHFSHLRLVAALTIQRYWQTGLTFIESVTWLKHWDERIHEEMTWNTSGVLLTKIERDQYLPQGHPLRQGIRITGMDLLNYAGDMSFRTHYPIVKHFLTFFVFPQLKMRTQRVTSSPYDLQAGFLNSIQLTATAGLTACYPIYLNQKNVISNESFEAQVLTTLLNKQNQTICILDDTQPNATLHSLFKTESTSAKFTDAVALIDRGALFANMVDDSVRLCLRNGFASTHQLFFQYSVLNRLLCISGERTIPVRANSIPNDLQREGIALEQHRALYFLDLAHTTGVDLKLPYQGQALLTVGKSQTTTQTIQASMRMRQLLSPNGQHLVWMMLKSFYLELSQDMQQFTLPKLLTWMLENEAKETRIRVLMSARQGIHFIIENSIYQKLKVRPEFIAKVNTSLKMTHWQKVDETKVKVDSMKNHLRSIAEQICASFHMNFDDLSDVEQKQIKEIINRASLLLQEKTVSVKNSNISAQEYSLELSHEQTATHKEQQQLKSQVKDNQYHSPLDYQYCVEQYDLIDHPDAIFAPNDRKAQDRYPQFKFSSCKVELPKLRMHIPHFTTINVKGFFKENAPYLKPVQGLLICIKPDNSISEPISCSITGMRFYEMQLRSSKSNNRYVLVDSHGSLIAKSSNCSLQDANTAKQNTIILEALSFAAFLNGQIRFAKVLANIVKKYCWKSEDYLRMNQQINAMHTSHAEIKTYDAKVYELLVKISELMGDAKDQTAIAKITNEITALVPRNSSFAFRDLSNHRSSVDEQRAWYPCYYR